MRYKFILFTILVLLSIQFAIAATEINVRTWSDHKVSIFLLVPDQVYTLIDSFHIYSNSSGDVRVAYTGNSEIADIKVQISKDGKSIMQETLEDFDLKSPVYIQVIAGNISKNYKELEKAAETKIIENTTIEQNQTSSTTGRAVTENKAGNQTEGSFDWSMLKPSKTIYYIIGGIILGLVLLFFVFKVGVPMFQNSRLQQPQTRVTVTPINSNSMHKELDEAERKLKEAQNEINKIRNRELEKNLREQKIKETEKKLENDKKELEKLRRGY